MHNMMPPYCRESSNVSRGRTVFILYRIAERRLLSLSVNWRIGSIFHFVAVRQDVIQARASKISRCILEVANSGYSKIVISYIIQDLSNRETALLRCLGLVTQLKANRGSLVGQASKRAIYFFKNL